MDLIGGYYDTCDNVKFGLPLAFTLTVLSWGVVEYGERLRIAGQLGNSLNAIWWGTDYLLKASKDPDQLWVQVRTGKLGMQATQTLNVINTCEGVSFLWFVTKSLRSIEKWTKCLAWRASPQQLAKLARPDRMHAIQILCLVHVKEFHFIVELCTKLDDPLKSKLTAWTRMCLVVFVELATAGGKSE